MQNIEKHRGLLYKYKVLKNRKSMYNFGNYQIEFNTTTKLVYTTLVKIKSFLVYFTYPEIIFLDT